MCVLWFKDLYEIHRVTICVPHCTYFIENIPQIRMISEIFLVFRIFLHSELICNEILLYSVLYLYEQSGVFFIHYHFKTISVHIMNIHKVFLPKIPFKVGMCYTPCFFTCLVIFC